MKKNNKKNEDEGLVSLIRSDTKITDDHLEDRIMDKILQQPSMTLTKQKGINRSRDMIIVGYCILTFIALTWCLSDNNIFTHFHMPDSNWQLVTEDQYVKYYLTIIMAAMLSAFSFIDHWMQSKKHRFRNQSDKIPTT